jgi:hypothetical protein
MPAQVRLFGGGALLALFVSGCPITDDYYIDTSRALSGGGDQAVAGTPSSGGSVIDAGGSSPGGSAGRGSGGVAGSLDMPAGGAVEVGEAGADGAAGAGCVPRTERCNGHDDNCDDIVDELACNSTINGTTGCSGFVVASRPDHGYMLCTTSRKDWTHASDACTAQDMRLAWLDSAAENSEVSKKLDALSSETEVLFGATDAANEGVWRWFGGAQFWQGDENGESVGGLFNNWAAGTPNNDNNGEDCVVLNPMTGFWGDRVCSATYAYVCEEPD